MPTCDATLLQCFYGRAEKEIRFRKQCSKEYQRNKEDSDGGDFQWSIGHRGPCEMGEGKQTSAPTALDNPG